MRVSRFPLGYNRSFSPSDVRRRVTGQSENCDIETFAADPLTNRILMSRGLADGHQSFGETCCFNIYGTSVNVSSILTTDSTDYFEASASIKITGYHTVGDNTAMQVTQFLMMPLAGEMSKAWRVSSELCLL